jgi:hypothetical protein
MSHDRIRAEVRRRMARTGEPYQVAWRKVVQLRKKAQFREKLTAAEPGMSRKLSDAFTGFAGSAGFSKVAEQIARTQNGQFSVLAGQLARSQSARQDYWMPPR